MTALAAENLLPREGDDIELGEVEVLRKRGRGRVADRQALAVGRDEVGVRNADTEVVPFQVKTTSWSKLISARFGSSP